jgi:hypothetical protein
MRITASEPRKISFTLKMDSPQTNSATKALARDTLALTGQVETNGLRFESRVRAVCDGGTVTTNANSLVVENANSAMLFLAAATSFNNYQDISGDPAAQCAKDLAAVSEKSFFTVRVRQLADFQPLFNRVNLNFGHIGQRPRAGRALFSIRPLPAHLQQPARRTARKSAGPLERGTRSTVGEQVDAEHQLRDELLAGRAVQSE